MKTIEIASNGLRILTLLAAAKKGFDTLAQNLCQLGIGTALRISTLKPPNLARWRPSCQRRLEMLTLGMRCGRFNYTMISSHNCPWRQQRMNAPRMGERVLARVHFRILV